MTTRSPSSAASLAEPLVRALHENSYSREEMGPWEDLSSAMRLDETNWTRNILAALRRDPQTLAAIAEALHFRHQLATIDPLQCWKREAELEIAGELADALLGRADQ